MTTTTERCNGELTYVENVTREARVEVDEDGNAVIVDGFDNLDVDQSSLHCDKCGYIAWDTSEAHGLSRDWEVR